MLKRSLGRTGLEVTILGFGGSEIAFEGATQETVDRLLGAALDVGLNVIDTAECYPNGEVLIGNAVAHRRDDYFLFSKIGHSQGHPWPDWDLRLLEAQIDEGLKRLKTDRLDLIQLHSCSEDLLRQGDVIRVLERAKAAGKTRFIGYSGDGHAALYAAECGAFDTLQMSINIADQQNIALALPRARDLGLGVIAKRPIANVVWKTNARPSNPYHHDYWDRLQVLKYPFLEDPLETSIAAALRFTLFQDGVSTAIVGTQNPDRWAQNSRLIADGGIESSIVESIRARWDEIAPQGWVGLT